MDFIKVLIVIMKLKHLHLRTEIKQRLFKQYFVCGMIGRLGYD